VSQPEPFPKIGGDRQRHPRPRAALRRRLRARPPTPPPGTLPVSYVLDGYTGPIYAALDFYRDNDFRNGDGLQYSVAKIGSPQRPELAPLPGPSAVPLPMPGVLVLAALGSLAALRRFRRA
jgi:hypothetical protein